MTCHITGTQFNPSSHLELLLGLRTELSRFICASLLPSIRSLRILPRRVWGLFKAFRSVLALLGFQPDSRKVFLLKKYEKAMLGRWSHGGMSFHIVTEKHGFKRVADRILGGNPTWQRENRRNVWRNGGNPNNPSCRLCQAAALHYLSQSG